MKTSRERNPAVRYRGHLSSGSEAGSDARTGRRDTKRDEPRETEGNCWPLPFKIHFEKYLTC